MYIFKHTRTHTYMHVYIYISMHAFQTTPQHSTASARYPVAHFIRPSCTPPHLHPLSHLRIYVHTHIHIHFTYTYLYYMYVHIHICRHICSDPLHLTFCTLLPSSISLPYTYTRIYIHIHTHIHICVYVYIL